MWAWRQTQLNLDGGLPAREEAYREAIAAGEWFDTETGYTDLDPRHLLTKWLRRSGQTNEAEQILTAIASEGAHQVRDLRDLMAYEHKTYRSSYQEQLSRRRIWLIAQRDLVRLLAARGQEREAARWWRIASEDPWCELDLSLPRSVVNPCEDPSISPVLLHLRKRLLARVNGPLADYILARDAALPGTAHDDRDAARSYRFLDWLLRVYLPEWLALADRQDLAAMISHPQSRVTGAQEATVWSYGSVLPPYYVLQNGTLRAPDGINDAPTVRLAGQKSAWRSLRSVLWIAGMDVAADLQEPDVAGSAAAASHRALSGDPLWIALWFAAERQDLTKAQLPHRAEFPRQGEWAHLWDRVSRAASDAIVGAAGDIALRLGDKNPGARLDRALSLLLGRVARQCQHHLVALYGELLDM